MRSSSGLSARLRVCFSSATLTSFPPRLSNCWSCWPIVFAIASTCRRIELYSHRVKASRARTSEECKRIRSASDAKKNWSWRVAALKRIASNLYSYCRACHCCCKIKLHRVKIINDNFRHLRVKWGIQAYVNLTWEFTAADRAGDICKKTCARSPATKPTFLRSFWMRFTISLPSPSSAMLSSCRRSITAINCPSTAASKSAASLPSGTRKSFKTYRANIVLIPQAGIIYYIPILSLTAMCLWPGNESHEKYLFSTDYYQQGLCKLEVRGPWMKNCKSSLSRINAFTRLHCRNLTPKRQPFGLALWRAPWGLQLQACSLQLLSFLWTRTAQSALSSAD